MAVVTLHTRLRELAGGVGEVRIEAGSVGELVAELERLHPRTTGWISDERGRIREHVSLFVNGERSGVDTALGPDDTVHTLPSISGGSATNDPTEVLVGTRKGLFVLRGDVGRQMEVAARLFPGTTVEYAMRDSRSGTYIASVTHGQYGPRLYLAGDSLGEWEQAEGPAFPSDVDAAVKRIWAVVPGEADGLLCAGVDPAALFESGDGGRTWSLNRALWNVPTRPAWQPGFVGLCLHSICPWPGQPERLAIGISAAGVWLIDDGGSTWRTAYSGLVPRYLPEEVRATSHDLCVHNMHRAPLRPERLFLQFHGGIYRSDDAGETWNPIADGLPSDFGFPLVIDPRNPERAFVIPLVGAEDRVTPEGRVRVYETTDAGSTWQARGDGLPSSNAYLTILRQAFDHDGGDPLGLCFGATSGTVFGSADGGGTWAAVAERLAPVLSVRFVR